VTQTDVDLVTFIVTLTFVIVTSRMSQISYVVRDWWTNERTDRQMDEPSAMRPPVYGLSTNAITPIRSCIARKNRGGFLTLNGRLISYIQPQRYNL